MEDLLAAAEGDMGGDDYDDETVVVEEQEAGDAARRAVKGGGTAAAPTPAPASTPAPVASVAITKEEEVDDGALVARISEFFPQANKLVYQIESRNTLDHFEKRASTVCRKFEDFSWLHERLSENTNLAGVLIPFLPPKVTWTDVDESQTSQKVVQQDTLEVQLIDQFQKRALQLQRFLKYVCRHTLLREDIHVVVFLEYADELRPVSTASWFDRFSTPKIDLLPTDAQDSQLAVSFKWADGYKEVLGLAVTAADELSYFWRMLAVREREAVLELHSWRNDPGLGNAMSCLAKGLGRSQLQHHVRAQIADVMYDLLLDYTGIVVATQNMFGRRHGCFVTMLEAKKQAKKHDKALAESDETRAKHPALLVASTDAATVLTKATEQLVEVSATAELELVVAKNRRVADFKAVFIKLAEHEVHQGKQRQHEWGEILTELQGMLGACADPHPDRHYAIVPYGN